MSSIINQSPFLKTSREFPEQIKELSDEVNRAYVETASAINERIIGLFPKNRRAITGESWFFPQNKKRQTFRQMYEFTAAGNIPTGLTNLSTLPTITRAWGSYTDGTNQYGVIFANNQPIANQVTFYVALVGVNAEIVVIINGAAPAIVNGIIVLEWLSN